MAKKIAISNLKGGVGKTVTTFNLGAGLSRLKKDNGDRNRCLLIDLDPQSHLTMTIGGFDPKKVPTIVDIFNGRNMVECVTKTDQPNLDLIPSSLAFANQQKLLIGNPRGIVGLKSAIEKSYIDDEYDFIVIDCPPHMDMATTNGLNAADFYMIPIESGDSYSLEGAKILQDYIPEIKDVSNSSLKLLGYLITMKDNRKKLCNSMEKSLRSQFGDDVFKSVIRANEAVKQAKTKHQSIFYDPKNRDTNGWEDFNSLCKEVVKKTA